VDIFIRNGGHLSLLDLSDLSQWVENETVNIFFPSESVDGGTACVARGGAQNGDGALDFGFLEEVFKNVAEELQGDVFKGESGAVEKFQHPEVFELNGGSNLFLIGFNKKNLFFL
jgi:hypothetical protein